MCIRYPMQIMSSLAFLHGGLRSSPFVRFCSFVPNPAVLLVRRATFFGLPCTPSHPEL